MLRFIRAVSKATSPDGEPVHTRTLFPTQTKASSDGSYLTKWGLVERVGGVGWYRITKRGVSFLAGKLAVPAFADIRNNRVINWGPRRKIDKFGA